MRIHLVVFWMWVRCTTVHCLVYPDKRWLVWQARFGRLNLRVGGFRSSVSCLRLTHVRLRTSARFTCQALYRLILANNFSTMFIMSKLGTGRFGRRQWLRKPQRWTPLDEPRGCNQLLTVQMSSSPKRFTYTSYMSSQGLVPIDHSCLDYAFQIGIGKFGAYAIKVLALVD